MYTLLLQFKETWGMGRSRERTKDCSISVVFSVLWNLARVAKIKFFSADRSSVDSYIYDLPVNFAQPSLKKNCTSMLPVDLSLRWLQRRWKAAKTYLLDRFETKTKVLLEDNAWKSCVAQNHFLFITQVVQKRKGGSKILSVQFKRSKGAANTADAKQKQFWKTLLKCRTLNKKRLRFLSFQAEALFFCEGKN